MGAFLCRSAGWKQDECDYAIGNALALAAEAYEEDQDVQKYPENDIIGRYLAGELPMARPTSEWMKVWVQDACRTQSKHSRQNEIEVLSEN